MVEVSILTTFKHAVKSLFTNCYTGGGAASGGADADKKEKAPKGGTAVKVTMSYM